MDMMCNEFDYKINLDYNIDNHEGFMIEFQKLKIDFLKLAFKNIVDSLNIVYNKLDNGHTLISQEPDLNAWKDKNILYFTYIYEDTRFYMYKEIGFVFDYDTKKLYEVNPSKLKVKYPINKILKNMKLSSTGGYNILHNITKYDMYYFTHIYYFFNFMTNLFFMVKPISS